MSNIQIRDALTQVDGAGSGVDADTLDGLSAHHSKMIRMGRSVVSLARVD